MNNKEALKTWTYENDNKSIDFIEKMDNYEILKAHGNILYYEKAFPGHEIKFTVKANEPLINICGICPATGKKIVFFSINALA